MKFTIKTANLSEVEMMFDWVTEEGGNPGLEDMRIFYQLDPHGFFVGYLGDKPITALACIRYNSFLSFLGLFLVAAKYREFDYGQQIWQHGLDYAGGSICILNSLPGALGYFKQFGFKSVYRNIRYVLPRNNLEHLQSDYLIDHKKIDLDLLLEFDARCYHKKIRDDFLLKWCTYNKTLVYLDHKEVRGYGVIRRCHNGYKIGPLLAEGRKIAYALFVGLANLVPHGEQIFLDVPDTNPEALVLMEFLRLKPDSESIRMYNGDVPVIDMNKIFGALALEIGRNIQ